MLDLNLPRKDGRETLAEIKADKNLASIPIVVLTTSQSEHDIMRAYGLHANCYITKPVDFTQFAHVVRTINDFWFTVVQLLIGLVVAASLFLSAKWGAENDPGMAPDSHYATVVRELSERFQTFFRSFSKVAGAQIIISAINTALTCGFLLWAGYSYVAVITATTFLCGVLPIIGNLISNTLIVFVGFTISPHTAFLALIFLIVIHKLEYFLNSKIIGDRIKTPMWLTLIGIVLGEKLMGIPGMILAPIVLHYLKVEASQGKSTVAA